MEDESAEYQFCESRQLNMSTLRMTAEAKVRSNLMCIITWLVPRAGKMKRILCSDWLPERGQWVYRACSGFPALVPQEKSSLGHIINRSFIDQNNRGRQYPAVFLDLVWSITRMSYLARTPQVSPLNTMPTSSQKSLLWILHGTRIWKLTKPQRRKRK